MNITKKNKKIKDFKKCKMTFGTSQREIKWTRVKIPWQLQQPLRGLLGLLCPAIS